LSCWCGLEEILKHSSPPWCKGNIEQSFCSGLKLSLCKVAMEVKEEDTFVRVCDLLWPWFAKHPLKKEIHKKRDDWWPHSCIVKAFLPCGTVSLYKSKSTHLHSHLWTKLGYVLQWFLYGMIIFAVHFSMVVLILRPSFRLIRVINWLTRRYG
jgi:hypothetical protein